MNPWIARRYFYLFFMYVCMYLFIYLLLWKILRNEEGDVHVDNRNCTNELRRETGLLIDTATGNNIVQANTVNFR